LGNIQEELVLERLFFSNSAFEEEEVSSSSSSLMMYAPNKPESTFNLTIPKL
jgi:hypothetical protein